VSLPRAVRLKETAPRYHPSMQWDIRRQGRAWTAEEAASRWRLTPEKFELIDGKLFWREEDRVALLAMLLEQVGIDGAIRLAPIELWREAIREIDRS